MAIRGLLNGQTEFDLGEYGYLEIDSITQIAEFEYRLTLNRIGDSLIWSKILSPFGVDQTKSSANERDFAVSQSPDGLRVFLAGRSGCVVLSVESGSELARDSLCFVDRDMDVLSLQQHDGWMLVISTKRVLVYDSGPLPRHVFDTSGLIQNARIVANELIVSLLDTGKAELPLVTERVALPPIDLDVA